MEAIKPRFPVQTKAVPAPEEGIPLETGFGPALLKFDSGDVVRALSDERVAGVPGPQKINGVEYRTTLMMRTRASWDDQVMLAEETKYPNHFEIVKRPSGIWVEYRDWLVTYDDKRYSLYRIGGGDPTDSAFEKVKAVVIPAIVNVLDNCQAELIEADLRARRNFAATCTNKVEELRKRIDHYNAAAEGVTLNGGSLPAGWALLNELSDQQRQRESSRVKLQNYLEMSAVR